MAWPRKKISSTVDQTNGYNGGRDDKFEFQNDFSLH